ncbi:hypothetical protein [Flavobacterium denitrificans]|uniref:hypothetical protein n=1 Tax=Flavobacterium denitrificans TaxID=281361 RepID=UPI000420186C|nr:hypothetical protein [Flavobacterium denitrificans]
MLTSNEIKEFNKRKRLEQVISLSKEYHEFENGDHIFYLKTFKETSKNHVLSYLKSIIDSQKNIALALKRNQKPYDFSRLDSGGIIKICYIFYDLYLVIDKKNRFYYLIIQENTFFENGKNCEIAYFKEVKPFMHKILFFNNLKLI